MQVEMWKDIELQGSGRLLVLIFLLFQKPKIKSLYRLDRRDKVDKNYSSAANVLVIKDLVWFFPSESITK